MGYQPLEVHASLAHFLNLSLLIPWNPALPFSEPRRSLLQCSCDINISFPRPIPLSSKVTALESYPDVCLRPAVVHPISARLCPSFVLQVVSHLQRCWPYSRAALGSRVGLWEHSSTSLFCSCWFGHV